MQRREKKVICSWSNPCLVGNSCCNLWRIHIPCQCSSLRIPTLWLHVTFKLRWHVFQRSKSNNQKAPILYIDLAFYLLVPEYGRGNGVVLLRKSAWSVVVKESGVDIDKCHPSLCQQEINIYINEIYIYIKVENKDRVLACSEDGFGWYPARS